ncbi:MAG: polysaccharide biosynthesis protein, partial [Hyphomicrobiaceae bacterium]
MPISEILHKLAPFRTWLVELPRAYKRALVVTNDLALLALALWLAMSFRLSQLYVPPNAHYGLLLALAPAIGVGTFAWFGLYRLVTRFIGQGATARIMVAVGLSVLIWALVVFMSGLALIAVPRSVVILYGLFAMALITASRQVAAWLLKDIDLPLRQRDRTGRRVAVFGAGPMGAQLVDAMHRTGQAVPVGFLDRTESMWGQYVGGLKVYRPEKIDRLIEREHITEVILALPKTHRSERRAILAELQRRPIRITTLPAMEEFAAGRITVSDIRPVEVADLLGRDAVPPDPHLLARHIAGKAVMVTGAGGSIGSELVRRILKQRPRVLVLYELSEAALYEIDSAVSESIAADPPGIEPPVVAGVLGSVLDEARIRDTIRHYGVATIYHAAAYKHVPIVEHNAVAGLRNNTFGTGVVAEAARDLGVERFVLISTDKAVRPTNVMGASKRLAELILQAHAADPACRTVFTMVRFGNVLDSSGSVVRLFRKQIEAGGPVTVTHPQIIRYFMSVSEAAELVIQAGAMA